MGLDTAELIIAVEDEFNIRFDNRELEHVRTVDDLRLLVERELAKPQEPIRCVTSGVFYQSRRALMDLFGVARGEVAPATELRTLVPRRRRRPLWHQLRYELGAYLPELERPLWLRCLILALALAVPSVPFVNGLIGFHLTSLLLFAVVALILQRVALDHTQWLAVEMRASCRTVGALVKTVEALKEPRPLEASTELDPQVREKLYRVIERETAIPRSQITPEARFVEDLNLD